MLPAHSGTVRKTTSTMRRARGSASAIWSSCSSQASKNRPCHPVSVAAMVMMAFSSASSHAVCRTGGQIVSRDCAWAARASAPASCSHAWSATRRTLSTGLPRAVRASPRPPRRRRNGRWPSDAVILQRIAALDLFDQYRHRSAQTPFADAPERTVALVLRQFFPAAFREALYQRLVRVGQQARTRGVLRRGE